MAETTIEWTRGPNGEAGYTFNTHWGCTEISPGCDNCYARRLAARFGVAWGADAERRTFDARHWADPEKWNRKAERDGTRPRVFTNSMADWADKDAPEGTRERLFALIERTPNLQWLLLTKRIGNVRAMLPARWFEAGAWPKNVRIGATFVNQEELLRDAGKLIALRVPNLISLEPLLGPIDLDVWVPNGILRQQVNVLQRIDWVIVGAESGSKARPAHLNWVRRIVNQCRVAEVACHVKQLGRIVHDDGMSSPGQHWPAGITRTPLPRRTDDEPAFAITLKHSKGGDMAEWPEDLRVREFPEVHHA